MKKLFFLILLTITLLFSGCGEEDCSTMDTTYEIYKWNSNAKECQVYTKITPDICGNGIADGDETYCSCKKDVLKSHPTKGCEGSLGTYLEKSCNQREECVLAQNEKVVEQIKTLQFKNTDLTIEGEFTLNTPFILNSEDNNKVKIDLSLFKTSSSANIKNIFIKELKIEDSKSTQLASIDYNAVLSNIGDSTNIQSVGLKDTTKYEVSETLKIKLVVAYTKESLDSQGQVSKTENKIETLTGSLGRWNIINPNFYE